MTWAIATPLQHTNIRRWLAELAHLLTQANATRRESRPKPHNYPGQREPFIEEAAMAREMFRI
jgi:hypothetical protein